MKKMIFHMLFACSIVMLNGCRNHLSCCVPDPPNSGALFLSIKHNGQPYPDKLMTGVKFYYYYNGEKISDPYKAPGKSINSLYDDTLLIKRVYTFDGTNEFPTPGVFTSLYALDAVVVANVNNFYLEFPDGVIDTLNIQVKNISEKDIESVSCQCLHQITSATLNGKPMQEETIQYSIYPQADNVNYVIEK